MNSQTPETPEKTLSYILNTIIPVQATERRIQAAEIRSLKVCVQSLQQQINEINNKLNATDN